MNQDIHVNADELKSQVCNLCDNIYALSGYLSEKGPKTRNSEVISEIEMDFEKINELTKNIKSTIKTYKHTLRK
tara:strand:- start:1366 stop:1587 length:222 start_codon:yes stop_codon:yes gene_type:complete